MDSRLAKHRDGSDGGGKLSLREHSACKRRTLYDGQSCRCTMHQVREPGCIDRQQRRLDSCSKEHLWDRIGQDRSHQPASPQQHHRATTEHTVHVSMTLTHPLCLQSRTQKQQSGLKVDLLHPSKKLESQLHSECRVITRRRARLVRPV
jgi:hypothetical protein